MGGKRLRIGSKFQLKKCAKISHGDRISQLPDDILVTILSSLPLVDAVKTSILSSRWTNLWKHTSSLNFDAELCKLAKQNELLKKKRRKKLLKKERRMYVNWVNCILRVHKATTLKNFRISFSLGELFPKAVTKWLGFVLTKKVQWLELDLSGYGQFASASSTNYAFPEELLLRESIDIKSLKALSLKLVNVSGEAIEFFLRNCPLLEELVVHGSCDLSNLEVCGSSLMLKHLELCSCYNLKSVKVSAPHLTSLVFTKTKKMSSEVLLLENVPMLVDVSISCESCEDLLPSFSSCISQVQVLNLTLWFAKENIELHNFPELSKLRKLVVHYVTWGAQSLIGLTTLIRTSPYLEEFVLHLCFDPLWSDRQVENSIKFVHQNLKVINVCGYYDCTSDELVKCILDNCVALEKITIDTRTQHWIPNHTAPIIPVELDAEELNGEETGRKFAKTRLQGEVPKHIELIIV